MPRLDRVEYKDPRSRDYPVRALMASRVVKQDTFWTYPRHFPLDQGEEGACVGFGWCHELGAKPVMYNTTNTYAFQYYSNAQIEDRLMGNKWSEGASVLAGAKVAHKHGMIGEYRWAFGLNDVIDAICSKGPVVLGVNWYESMYETERDGTVPVAGKLAGGHCITAVGYLCDKPGLGESIVLLNSWGPEWGINGLGYLSVRQADRLLREGGEACIPTDIIRR